MTQIHTRDSVARAYRRALALGASHDEALASTAQALGLPTEAIAGVVATTPSNTTITTPLTEAA